MQSICIGLFWRLPSALGAEGRRLDITFLVGESDTEKTARAVVFHGNEGGSVARSAFARSASNTNPTQRALRLVHGDGRGVIGWKLEPADVAQLAGHTNVRTTLDMYVGTTAGTLDRARRATL